MRIKRAYLIHCFSHQLQLTLLAPARDNNYTGDLCDKIGKLLNIVGLANVIFCMRNKLKGLRRH